MAETIKGITVSIGGDTTELQKALRTANREIKNTSRELKSVEGALKFQPGNVELLGQKFALVSDKINATKSKLEILKTAQYEVEEQFKNNKISVGQYEAFQREIAKCETQIKKLKTEILDVGAAFDTAFKNLGDTGTTLTTAITAPIAAMDVAAVKAGTDFEKSMSNVKAISGATGDELLVLRDKAKEMGANTSKSASESADALEYMALAGWKNQQMLTGLEPILRASEAGTMDLAVCSDLVTDSMSALGVVVEQLPHYLDVVTQTQNSANTSMQDLLTAYIDCGGTLKNLNVPLEESATWLGILANRGIKGAEAGTALNSILINLIGANSTAATAMDSLGVSAWDVNGNFIGMEATLKTLNTALNECTDEEKSFFEAKIGGKTQMDTLQALLAGTTEEYDVLKESITNCSGALQTTALIMQDNLLGDIDSFKSAAEGAGITISEILTPQIREFVQQGTALLRLFNNLDPAQQKTIIKITTMAAAFGPLLIATSKVGSTVKLFAGNLATSVKTIYSYVQTIRTAETAQQAFNIAVSTNPLGAFLTILGLVIAAFASYEAACALAGDETNEVTKTIKDCNSTLEQQKQTYEQTVKSIDDTAASRKAELEICNKQIDRLEELTEKTSLTASEENELNQIIKDLNSTLPDLNLKIDEQTSKLNLNANAIRDNVEAYKDLATIQAAKEKLTEITKNQLELREDYENNQKKISELKNKIPIGYVADDTTAGVALTVPSASETDETLKIYKQAEDLEKANIAIKTQIDNYEAEADRYSEIINNTYNKAENEPQPNPVEPDAENIKVNTTKDLSDYAKQNIKNWEYLYQSGQKNAQEYYDALKRIRDNYFNYDSEGWREYNLKVINLGKQIETEQKKQSTETTKSLTALSKERTAQIKEELSLLDWQHEQGTITTKAYYDGMKNIRDTNYTKMSEDWRSLTDKMATVQVNMYKSMLAEQESNSLAYIERMEASDGWGEDSAGKAYGRIKGRFENAYKNINSIAFDSVSKRKEYEEYLTKQIQTYAELQKQAFEDAYNTKYVFSADWIEDRNFYGDWSDYGTNEIESWKRVKATLEDTYHNGEIGYKTYAEKMKAIDKSIYTSSKNLAQELVESIKSNEQAKLDAVKNRIAKEKELLQDSYNDEDRQAKLVKLQTQEKYYRNAVTKEGQEKYESIVAEIKQLKREAELSVVEEKGNAEINAAEASYNQFERNIDNITATIANQLSSNNSVYLSEQYKLLSDNEKQVVEAFNSQSDTLQDMAINVGENISNIFQSYVEAQNAFLHEQEQKLSRFQAAFSVVGAAVGVANKLVSYINSNNTTTSTSNNFYSYGDYNFADSQDFDIFKKEVSRLDIFNK